MSRKYVSNTAELARFDLGEGVSLIQQVRSYGYEGEAMSSYNTHDLDGLVGTDIEQLAALAAILKNLPEDGALDLDVDALQEFLQEWAADTAEGAGLPFTFVDRDGDTNTYTPASMWEASGSCSEWEQSAQYGYDYGWNI